MMHPEELPVIDALGSLGISYTRYEHGLALTMEDCENIGADIGAKHFKNLFLTNRQGTDFYLMLIGADKKFRTAEVSRQLGVSRLSFCTPEQLHERLNLKPGSVTPLALIYDADRRITVVVDEDIRKMELVCVHPCTSEVSYAISGDDLFKFLAWRKNELRFVSVEKNTEE